MHMCIHIPNMHAYIHVYTGGGTPAGDIRSSMQLDEITIQQYSCHHWVLRIGYIVASFMLALGMLTYIMSYMHTWVHGSIRRYVDT